MYLYLTFWLLWNYDEIIKDALGVSSFILVHIRRLFKPCAFGRVKCQVQLLCNSVREGPDEYFVNIAICEKGTSSKPEVSQRNDWLNKLPT